MLHNTIVKMSRDNQEIQWEELGEGFRYQSDNKQKNEDDFNDIKITLNDYENAKYGSSNPHYDALRPSVLSSGNEDPIDEKPKQEKAPENNSQDMKIWNWLQIDYYSQFFNVTTEDVKQRLIFSWVPFGDKLSQVIGENPDFYGPFWIYASLLFILAFSENMHNLLLYGEDKFISDFRNVIPSCIMIYGIGFGLPLGLSFALKYFVGGELKFREIACIYGYSFTPILIWVLMWSIPVFMIQWIWIWAGLGINLIVLFLNLKKHLDTTAPKAKWIVVGVVCGIQFILMLIFKFRFLHQISRDI